MASDIQDSGQTYLCEKQSGPVFQDLQQILEYRALCSYDKSFAMRMSWVSSMQGEARKVMGVFRHEG